LLGDIGDIDERLLGDIGDIDGRLYGHIDRGFGLGRSNVATTEVAE